MNNITTNITNLSSQREQEPEESVLYIVSTPIGNLNDISIRAKNILEKVSLIACEDTRKTGNLLKYLKITNNLISFHKFNAKSRLDTLVTKLENGESIALVSDAGTPLISDPGYLLVKAAKSNNFDVISIPGPCAAIAALVCSGISTSEFTFYGFLPQNNKSRKLKLKKIANNVYTSILYESPQKIITLLEELKNHCGENRRIVVMRELTKKFEQHLDNKIENVLNYLKSNNPKGEFTIILEGRSLSSESNTLTKENLKSELIDLINAGLSHSSASNYLSKKAGLPKQEIYKLILENSLE